MVSLMRSMLRPRLLFTALGALLLGAPALADGVLQFGDTRLAVASAGDNWQGPPSNLASDNNPTCGAKAAAC